MEYRPYRQYHQLPLNRVSHNFELQNRNDTCYRILAPCLQDFFDMVIWNISYRLWPKSRIIWRVEDYPVSAGEVPCREFMEWDIFSKPLPVLGAGECCYSLQGYRNGSHGSRGSQGSHGILLDLTHFEWSSSVSSSKVIETTYKSSESVSRAWPPFAWDGWEVQIPQMRKDRHNLTNLHTSQTSASFFPRCSLSRQKHLLCCFRLPCPCPTQGSWQWPN